jgi:hypothetical protein
MDRTTKLLLAAIAIGLFANAFRPATAQFDVLSNCSLFAISPPCTIVSDLHKIEDHLDDISSGRCRNRRLC